MARRKKRRKPAAQPAPEKKGERFNEAFSALRKFKDKKRSFDAPEEPKPKGEKEDEEKRFFLEAMSGVQPLKDASKKVARPPDITMRPAHSAMEEELEAMAHLSDLVSGNAEMDITFSDEYIEGAVHGLNRKLMQALKKGHIPIQGHVDLHGLTKEQAKARVAEFLLQNHRQGNRCVLVVHGRGLNSENHIPVLKERLPVWLTRGSVRKIVLAFSTARPYDGGTGAVYILLRKRKGPA